MDLLDSIMSKMDKPPVINSKEKELMKKQQKAMEEVRAKEKEKIIKFRKSIEDRVREFMMDSNNMKLRLEPMERMERSIVRDVVDVIGLTCQMFGTEDVDRHVMLFKKEYVLTEEEIAAYRNGEEWDPVRARQEAIEKDRLEVESLVRARVLHRQRGSQKYLEKYERLVGKETGVAAAKVLKADDKQLFGCVRSELKTDKRTIEETMADIRAKKKKKENE